MNKENLKKQYEDFILKPLMSTLNVVKGDGVFLVDDLGNRYLDMVSGFGVSALGYHTEEAEAVKKAILEQMDQIGHNPYYLGYTEAPANYARKLAELTPSSVQKIFFCNSGSEAIEGAIRVVCKATGRHELIAPQQSFFGRTNGAASLTGLSQDKKGVPLLPGIYHIPAPYCYRCSLKHSFPECKVACAQYLEDVINFGTAGDVAALFVEPVLGDVGVIVPPKGYFDELVSICRKHNILLVVDETLTGLGRTGKMFACEHWNLQPDVLVMGKAIGGGLPLGGFMVSPEIAESFSSKDFSSSVGGNTMACAGGLATVNAIEELNICQHVQTVGDYLISGLQKLQQKYPQIGDVRGLGLLVGVEIIDPENNNTVPEVANRIKEQLLERGVLVTVYGDSTLRLTPALTIQQEEVDIFLSTFENVLKTL